MIPIPFLHLQEDFCAEQSKTGIKMLEWENEEQTLNEGIETMDRRSFLTWVGVGWLASSLPIAIASCTPTAEDASTPQANSSTPAPVETGADGFAAVGTLTQLKEKGALQANIAGEAVIVTNNAASTDDVLALESACTHRGCAVEWNPENQHFNCPCHGSKFAADGKVLEGPADQPLKTYESKIEGDTIFVKVS